MSYWWTAVWALLAMIIAGFWTRRMDKGERIDKGSVFCFWNLSYRRRFIRTVWFFPLGVIAVICIHMAYRDSLFSLVIGAELFGAFLIQAAYCYWRWKNSK